MYVFFGNLEKEYKDAVSYQVPSKVCFAGYFKLPFTFFEKFCWFVNEDWAKYHVANWQKSSAISDQNQKS